MPIVARPDHVAVAVPSIDRALPRWQDHLGGRMAVPPFDLNDDFATRQYRFRGDAKLELLEPKTPDGFAQRFLARFGARIHHVTLKVDDLDPAVETLRADGFDVVDVAKYGRTWHEAFLRPSQVGGLIVQVAWAGRTDAEVNALTGFAPSTPPPDGVVLRGAVLGHPDPEVAGKVWTALGGTAAVTRDGALEVAWDDAPLRFRIEKATEAAPLGLWFDGAEPLPHDPDAGAAVVVR